MGWKRNFMGGQLMAMGKLYNIDLNGIGYPYSNLLVTPSYLDPNHYRHDFEIISAEHPINTTVDYCPFERTLDPRGTVFNLALFPESIDKCSIEEVLKENLPLWIYAGYKSFKFLDLLSGK